MDFKRLVKFATASEIVFDFAGEECIRKLNRKEECKTSKTSVADIQK